MLLITIFVELRVVAGRSQTQAGSPQAVSQWPYCAVALRRTAWAEHGMASVNQTRPHCVNQMGKTHCKPLAAQHAMYESAFNLPFFMLLMTFVWDLLMNFLQEKPKYYESASTGVARMQQFYCKSMIHHHKLLHVIYFRMFLHEHLYCCVMVPAKF